MRLRTLTKKPLGPLSEFALYAGGGFLSSLLIFAGRAPVSIALLSVCRQPQRLLSLLSGGVLGAIVVMPFTAGLRQCGILILIYAMFSAFRDTRYISLEWFRPLTAVGMTGIVEFAYLLQHWGHCLQLRHTLSAARSKTTEGFSSVPRGLPVLPKLLYRSRKAAADRLSRRRSTAAALSWPAFSCRARRRER